MVMDRQIVTENVRRYRAIASLCRQTAALRPLQKWSLLDQAEGWERLAAEEAYFIVCNSTDGNDELVAPRAEARWELMAAACLARKGLVVDSGQRRWSERTGRYEIVWESKIAGK